MKNLIKKSIVFVLLLTTSLSNAIETPSLRNLNDGKTTILTLLHVKQGNRLKIKDLSGKVFYEESIQSSGKFKKGFNLSLLANGEYYFELDKYLEVIKIPFKVIKNSVQYNKERESITSKAIGQSKGNHLLVPKSYEIKKPVELEKGIQRSILTYKGGDFIKACNLNK